jgi:hypothetical protein
MDAVAVRQPADADIDHLTSMRTFLVIGERKAPDAFINGVILPIDGGRAANGADPEARQ